MAKRQTRRSISFRAEVFERMRRYCEANGEAMAAFVESLVTADLDAKCIAKVDRDEALAQITSKPPALGQHPGSHFTW